MRNFFIIWAERLITVFVAIMVIAVVAGSLTVMFTPAPQGGLLRGLGLLLFGGIYSIMMGGLMYLFFGIYRNTQETNRLLAELLRK